MSNNNSVGSAIKKSCETGSVVALPYSREDSAYLYTVCHTADGYIPGRQMAPSDTPTMVQFVGERRDGQQWTITMPNGGEQ